MTLDASAYPPPGQAVPPPPPPPPPPPAPQGDVRDPRSVASLVVGIVSVVICALGMVAGPVAIGLGVAARKAAPADAKALWGLVLGVAGTVLSLLAWVSAVATFSQQRAHERSEAAATTTAVDEASDLEAAIEAAAALELTENGVVASGYSTAHEAWSSVYDAESAWDGMYAGDGLESPCYSMDGEPWWLSSAEDATCDGQSELWWETYPDSAGYEIKLFGAGGVGAAITVDAVPAALAAEYAPGGSLAEMSDYVTTTLLPESGVSATSTSETTIAGGLAVVIEVDSASFGLEDYRFYVLKAPSAYDDAEGAQFFLVHVYNEAGWIYDFDDTVSRFEESFTWK